MGFSAVIAVGAFILFVLANIFKILPEWERGVVLRLGRYVGTRGPGLIILVPFIERLIRVDTRTVTLDIEPQDVITKDNVTIKVNAVIYFRVLRPDDAINRVENYFVATTQLAQTTLRSVLGQYELDDLLASREEINHTLQDILDKATEPWGIKISMVETKQIDLPTDMQKAMARQAEAERERRAKVINAEGELQRAEKLAQASNKLAESPSALQLAYLQTLNEITDNNMKTVIFPLPMDLVAPFLEKKDS
ncbi:MAG: hypothetical protein CL675_10680 [Bdellovibrionaceae bacterium]|nr:hypothetical protein [Pseudobdellovibrionaceae bacterium]